MQTPGRQTGKQKVKKIQEQEEIQNIQELNQEQNWTVHLKSAGKAGRNSDNSTTKHRILIRDRSTNNRDNHEGGNTRQRQEEAQPATWGWTLQNKTGSNKTGQVKEDVDCDEVGWQKHLRFGFSSSCLRWESGNCTLLQRAASIMIFPYFTPPLPAHRPLELTRTHTYTHTHRHLK